MTQDSLNNSSVTPNKALMPPICERIIFFNEEKATVSEWVGNGRLSDEFALYVENGFKPTHWIAIPDAKDPRWKPGNPEHIAGVQDNQILTLSPSYPSQELKACLEVKHSEGMARYPNHPVFSGAQAWMFVEDLRAQAIPMPSLHEIRHGRVEQWGDYRLGDLVVISVGLEERLGRIVSLTHKQRCVRDGNQLMEIPYATLYVAELGRDEHHAMVFDEKGQGIAGSLIRKVDMDATIQGHLCKQGDIKATQVDGNWVFMSEDGAIDERELFGMKVLSIECEPADSMSLQ